VSSGNRALYPHPSIPRNKIAQLHPSSEAAYPKVDAGIGNANLA
jgi:hypothetical protein